MVPITPEKALWIWTPDMGIKQPEGAVGAAGVRMPECCVRIEQAAKQCISAGYALSTSMNLVALPCGKSRQFESNLAQVIARAALACVAFQITAIAAASTH